MTLSPSLFHFGPLNPPVPPVSSPAVLFTQPPVPVCLGWSGGDAVARGNTVQARRVSTNWPVSNGCDPSTDSRASVTRSYPPLRCRLSPIWWHRKLSRIHAPNAPYLLLNPPPPLLESYQLSILPQLAEDLPLCLAIYEPTNPHPPTVQHHGMVSGPFRY